MKHVLMVCVALGALAFQPAYAETAATEKAKSDITVTEKTTVQQKELPNYRETRFMDFDLNGDGTLSRDEVGEKLFEIFDRDGNEVIDNKEMHHVGVLSFIPMEKETIQVVDYDIPGMKDKVNVSYEEFMEKSNLIKFDKDEDGLTPLDFIGKPFNQIDVTRDKVIDLAEWKRAYAASVKPLHEEQFYYNN